MRMSKLFQRQLIREVLLFALLAIIMSFFFSTTLRSRLSEEFINRGHAISDSIASSSIELILNRDASTIQSTIDQFVEAGNGVGYVYVANHQHELVAHTFVPNVPDEIYELMANAHDDSAARDVTIPGQGNFLDITTPILEGSVGFAHVGMDRNLIDSTIRSVILTQVGLISLIFLISAGIAYTQANQISKPLIRLAEFASQVTSTKNFSQTAVDASKELAPIAQRNDEVGQLTQNFQQMLQEVIEREHKLELRSLELAQANQEITDLSKRLKVENIRLEAKLGATRQQNKSRRRESPSRVKVEDDIRDIIIVEPTQNIPTMVAENALESTTSKSSEDPPIIEVEVIQQSEPTTEIQTESVDESPSKSITEPAVTPVAEPELIEDGTLIPELNPLDLTYYLQQLLLPTAYEIRRIDNLEIAGASTNKSGDYYDWLMQYGQIQIGVISIRGRRPVHGMLMLMTSSVMRTLLTSDENEQSLFLTSLQHLMRENQQSSGQSTSLALLDLRDDNNLALGGQNSQIIIVDEQSEVSLIDPYDLDLPVGLRNHFKDSSHIHFQAIQSIVLYSNDRSDLQSQNKSEQLEKIKAIVSDQPQASAKELSDHITAELKQTDGVNDFTLLVIKQKL